jgi:hypothetical protein
MATTRTVVDFTVAGAIIGVVVASIVVPPALAWYNAPGKINPGKPIETLCDLPALIRYATGHLIRGQLIGAAIGAALFFVIGLLVARGRARDAAPPSAPVPVP